MKILVDTNVLLDVLAKREPHYAASAQILQLGESGRLTAFITANTVTDVYYILRKYIADRNALKEVIHRILKIVDITAVLKSDVIKALELDFSDYEDALSAKCAERIKADYIVTRNIKDFKHSPVTPITPVDLIKSFVANGDGSST